MVLQGTYVTCARLRAQLSLSVAVLCGELLREAEKLIDQRIHPQVIIDGWRIALTLAREALENSARDNSVR